MVYNTAVFKGTFTELYQFLRTIDSPAGLPHTVECFHAKVTRQKQKPFMWNMADTQGLAWSSTDGANSLYWEYVDTLESYSTLAKGLKDALDRLDRYGCVARKDWVEVTCGGSTRVPTEIRFIDAYASRDINDIVTMRMDFKTGKPVPYVHKFFKRIHGSILKESWHKDSKGKVTVHN